VPAPLGLDPGRVTLGERLFHDPRLSQNNSISCAHCHDLRRGGSDGQGRSVGLHGAVGEVNAPTVFNSSLNFVQFWDGRAPSLEAQIDGPIHHPKEMGASWPEIIAKLKQDADYAAAFSSLYPDGLSSQNIKDAIATFERSLLTPDSRFDRFLRGESDVLTAQEKAGYALFKAYGCVACHQGVNVGGNMFQRFGVMRDYFDGTRELTKADLGRFNATGASQDRHIFKVPSLRNIALTAPYFHDGSAPTLEAAIHVMATYQLGRSIPPDDVDLIVQFLHTLTGTYQGKSLAE
jgi:cytochrome c peroxidase